MRTVGASYMKGHENRGKQIGSAFCVKNLQCAAKKCRKIFVSTTELHPIFVA